MAKRKDPHAPQVTADPSAPAGAAGLPPAPQLPVIEAPALAAAAVAARLLPPVAVAAAPDAGPAAAVAQATPEVTGSDRQPETLAAGEPPAAVPPAAEPVRPRPLIRLAAGLAAAAAIGALAGSFGSAGLTQLVAAAPHAPQDMRIPADLARDIAALRASVETLARGTNGQFSKVAERLDSLAKAQAEPNAKIARLSEALDRIERRTAAAPAAASPEVTGTVPAQTAAAETKLQDRVVPGWVLRDYYRGRAVVESRYGIYEVSPGANLPGVGPVETIRRQDGRWVVVTPKGLIVSSR